MGISQTYFIVFVYFCDQCNREACENKYSIETTNSGILYLTPWQYIVSKSSNYIYLLWWRPLQAKLFKLDHHPLVWQASAQRIKTLDTFP
jgi:hypothetical protein